MKKKTKLKLKPNIRLLRRIQQAIVKHHDQFLMSSLFSHFLDDGRDAGGCGTAGCIAGWALHLTAGNKRLDKTHGSGYGINSSIKKAGELIGVKTTFKKHIMTHPLFFADQWPEPFRSKYAGAAYEGTTSNNKKGARIAAGRIEHFIKTGE